MKKSRSYQRKKNSKRSTTHHFDEHGKVPPQASDLEEAILGSIMLENNALIQVVNVLKPEMFYKEAHQVIYAAIKDLVAENVGVDILTVTEQLKKRGELELSGGPYYITQLTNRVASAANILFHMRIVHQKYIKRELIKLSAETMDGAFDETVDTFELFDNARDSFKNLDVAAQENIIKKVGESIDAAMKTMAIEGQEETEENMRKLFYKTGDDKFDDILGFGPGNILMIGGKSGGGKTSKVIDMMKKLLRRNNDISIKWYSMEDPSDKIVRAFFASEVLLTDQQLRGKDGYKMPKERLDKLESVKAWLKMQDIEFVHNKAYIDNIGMDFKNFCQKRPDRFNILIIDNVGFLKDHDLNLGQTQIDDHIARVIDSWDIKTDDSDMKRAVIVIHHFTDEQQEMANLKYAYRPREKHFKGSTRFRDCMTQIMLTHKPSQFPDLVQTFPNVREVLENIMLMDIAKNRNGNTGVVRQFVDLGYKVFYEI